MNTLKPTVKLAVLVACAVLFAATMIGLSVRSHPYVRGESYGPGGDKKSEKTFSVSPGGKLIVKADEGDITISGTESSEVSVRVYARGSDEQLRRFDVQMNQEGNDVRIDGRQERKYFHLFENNSLDVQYDIHVPRDFNLDLGTAGGNITVDNVKGAVDGGTSGGDLDLSRLEGKVNLTTSGGNIGIRESNGGFTLETSGGNIRAEAIVGDMSLETSGGNIDLRNGDGKLTASTSGGNIRVQLRDNKGIDLSTSGGNLTVRLPKTTSGDVRAEATGGDVNCEFEFSGKLKDGSLNGKINGGGNPIRLETSGGDIMINSIE